jgi:hypothetical protein
MKKEGSVNIYYGDSNGKKREVLFAPNMGICDCDKFICRVETILPYELTPEMYDDLITFRYCEFSTNEGHYFALLRSTCNYGKLEYRYGPKSTTPYEQEDGECIVEYSLGRRNEKEEIPVFLKKMMRKFWLDKAEYNLQKLSDCTLRRGTPGDYLKEIRTAVYQLSALHDQEDRILFNC